MAFLKKWKIASVGEDVENLEPLCIAGGNHTATVKNILAVPQKVKQNYHMISSSTPGYIPKRTKSRDSN